ncbi:putative helicase MAGATAMA 3 [Ananas comosus]|uniref:Putative helicase MAGATAMA 3 n=1 Tax=Ananas comosus TaxID=4615 RepID=A0A199UNS4_ANACO|nr:putative helicase MAGATAMA 3 [Ananas comosus]
MKHPTQAEVSRPPWPPRQVKINRDEPYQSKKGLRHAAWEVKTRTYPSRNPPSVEHAFQLPSGSSVAQHWLCLGGTKSNETDWQKGAVASCTESDGFHKVSMAVLDDFRENGRETLALRTFLTGEVKKLRKAEPEHSQESFLWILRICSLSTIMREYVALHSIVSLPFKDMILSARENSNDVDVEDRTWNVPRPLMNHFKTYLNPSQLDAIHAGLSRRSFVLIQGPPGTGKTQTILGLLSAVLHSAPARVQSKSGLPAGKHRAELQIEDRYSQWTKASPWLVGANPRDLIMPVDGDDGFFPTGNELKPEVISSNRKYRVHVLVCAPSNSALDEIVLRVLRTGIHDENDHVYNPKIVRIGLKPHHSVRAVSMDYLVEQKLAGVDRLAGNVKQGSGGAYRERIRASILDEAAIVFSTLSFSGSSLFSRMNRVFDVEPATLVPLVHGCRQVGDPVQLPATVISPTAGKFGYGTSLFKRFQEAGFPVQMLNVQYRMHPKTQPSGSGSWVNEQEVEFIVALYYKLATLYPELRSSSLVAIISPYRYQVKLLREHFRATFGEQSDQVVDINTVDGFQGREKEVVIFSCVRANEGKGIGFVSDFRRMNVGITRARSAVLVVGSASTLVQDDHWGNLVKSAKDDNCFFEVPKPFAAFFSDDKLEAMRVKKQREGKEREDWTADEEMARVENMAVDHGADDADDGMADDGMDVDGGYDE